LTGALNDAIEFDRARPENGRRDWSRLFTHLGQATLTLALSPLIQTDPQARGLVRRIADSQDMDEFACYVELLALRVSELSGQPVAADAGGSRGIGGQTTSASDDESPLRTFIRL
jgi:hypothetical protein